MRILIFGASGMLGNAMLRFLSQQHSLVVFGTIRSQNTDLQALAPRAKLLNGINADQPDSLLAAFNHTRPHVVINCVGLVKQLLSAEDPLEAIPINGMLPHRLARLCELTGSRLVHFSTDCVFSGSQGNYSETDLPDARDLYGRSKLIGEVSYRHTITLRTSIIGHELGRENGLIGWFLAQQRRVKGFKKAIFSGLPTCELARVVRDYVIPNTDLHGVYHVAAEPISKYDLLCIINRQYKKALQVDPDEEVIIDRSLNASRFRDATSYAPSTWLELIAKMHAFQ